MWSKRYCPSTGPNGPFESSDDSKEVAWIELDLIGADRRLAVTVSLNREGPIAIVVNPGYQRLTKVVAPLIK